MSKIDELAEKADWIRGVFIEGTYRPAQPQKTGVMGGFSLSEAVDLGFIEDGEKITRYDEDDWEDL